MMILMHLHPQIAKKGTCRNDRSFFDNGKQSIFGTGCDPARNLWSFVSYSYYEDSDSSFICDCTSSSAPARSEGDKIGLVLISCESADTGFQENFSG